MSGLPYPPYQEPEIAIPELYTRFRAVGSFVDLPYMQENERLTYFLEQVYHQDQISSIKAMSYKEIDLSFFPLCDEDKADFEEFLRANIGQVVDIIYDELIFTGYILTNTFEDRQVDAWSLEIKVTIETIGPYIIAEE